MNPQISDTELLKHQMEVLQYFKQKLCSISRIPKSRLIERREIRKNKIKDIISPFSKEAQG